MLAHHLWERVSEASRRLSTIARRPFRGARRVEAGVRRPLRGHASAADQKTLRSIIAGDGSAYRQNILRRLDLEKSTASAAVLRLLGSADIEGYGERKYRVVDPLYAEWIAAIDSGCPKTGRRGLRTSSALRGALVRDRPGELPAVAGAALPRPLERRVRDLEEAHPVRVAAEQRHLAVLEAAGEVEVVARVVDPGLAPQVGLLVVDRHAHPGELGARPAVEALVDDAIAVLLRDRVRPVGAVVAPDGAPACRARSRSRPGCPCAEDRRRLPAHRSRFALERSANADRTDTADGTICAAAAR